MWKVMIISCVAFASTLSAEVNVLAFAGSTREDSVNKKLVAEAAKLADQMQANVTVIDLKDYPIPFYDGDLEAKEGMPLQAKRFRQLLIRSDVILIASPEYNASVSPVLKNAIDWASRSEEGRGSREAFNGKKFVLMGASPGASGGSRGLLHLRTILADIGGIVLPEQVTVPDAYNAFDDEGRLKNEKVKNELKQLVEASLH